MRKHQYSPQNIVTIFRSSVTHCTGKTGRMVKKNPCQGKHREFANFAKTQGIWFAQVVNYLILNIKRYFKICHENLQKLLKRDKSAK